MPESRRTTPHPPGDAAIARPRGAIALEHAFRRRNDRGRCALVSFLAAGDPDYDATRALARAVADAGADVIELGVPFSDPLADGPIIQAAYQRALRGGASFAGVIDCAARIAAELEPPLVLMVSVSTILAVGPEIFCAAAAGAGVSGLIVPDLPLEDADGLAAHAAARELAIILLVAPDTPRERAARIARTSTGFVYLVRRRGVTGDGAVPDDGTAGRARALRDEGAPAVAVGFGIATPDDARTAAAGADGVIVGSALVEAAAEAFRTGGRAAAVAAVHTRTTALRTAIDAAAGAAESIGLATAGKDAR